MNNTLKLLESLDIVITIFNQEEIIERVLYGVFRNTTTPFNLIIIFDGCSDRTKPRALKYIKKVKPHLLLELIIHDTPNLFELRANNFAFRLAKTKYMITIQDDMVIREYGWERRLTYPLRKFDDVLAVTARIAENIESINNGVQKLVNQKGRELNTLSRNIFAIRDVINRGPIAFRIDYLKDLNYLNDKYAPCAIDDHELSLRAWRDRRWKVGAYWIDYFSHKAWSKTHASDSTMKAFDMAYTNKVRLYNDFKGYIDSCIKHNEEIIIDEKTIDYVQNNIFLRKLYWFLQFPLRIDKRALGMTWRIRKHEYIEAIKRPLFRLLGSHITALAQEQGIKKAILFMIKGNKL